jgi:2-keto-4-pentenoate hydratase/2-oxohepta-3-ene-1,7-dioic acid hydratase in catechol pathway
MVSRATAVAVAVFCADDNYTDQSRPRRAGLALQQPESLRPLLSGAPIESVLITAADPRALVSSGAEVLCPVGCERLDVGVSLAAVIGGGEEPGIAAYQAVLDFMRLDVPPTQTYLARSFPTHKVLGEAVAAKGLDVAAGLRIRLRVDGELRQDSTTARMIATPAELVATIARRYELGAGDLVLTGSPSGRPADSDGPWISPGSVVEGEIEGVGAVAATVVPERAG